MVRRKLVVGHDNNMRVFFSKRSTLFLNFRLGADGKLYQGLIKKLMKMLTCDNQDASLLQASRESCSCTSDIQKVGLLYTSTTDSGSFSQRSVISYCRGAFACTCQISCSVWIFQF